MTQSSEGDLDEAFSFQHINRYGGDQIKVKQKKQKKKKPFVPTPEQL